MTKHSIVFGFVCVALLGGCAHKQPSGPRYGSLSGGTVQPDIDDAAFTPATSRGNVVMAEADETSADAVDEGDKGAVRMTLQRGVHINVRNASGTEVGTASAAFRVDPVGTTTQPVSVSAPSGGPYTSEISVTTAGTRVQATAQALTQGCFAQPIPGNTGDVYVGGSDVASTNGWTLDDAVGDYRVWIGAANRNQIYADAAVNGEDVRLICY